jgi:hypothetical protein
MWIPLSLRNECTDRAAARRAVSGHHKQGASLAIALTLALSACQAPLSGQGKSEIVVLTGKRNAEGERGVAKSEPSVSPHRYILLKRDNWQDSNHTARRDVRDLYTNVIIAYQRGNKSDAQRRNYGEERYSWVSRLFTSRTETLTGAAKLALTGSGLGVSFPGAVFSFTHKSNRDEGETFETNIRPRTISTSTFLIPANGVLAVDLQVKTSTRVEGQYAARALDMVSAAVGTVTPNAKFVNELSKPGLKAAAAELDKGISKLQSDDVEETTTAHFNISTWTLDAHAIGEFRIPWDVRGAENKILDDMVRVGEWKIYLRCPRVSLFSERHICSDATLRNDVPGSIAGTNVGAIDPDKTKWEQIVWTQKKKVARELSNREILNFKIAPDKTIGEFAKAQTWYQDWLSERKAKPGTEKPLGPTDSKVRYEAEDPIAESRNQRFCDNAAHDLGTGGRGNMSAFDAGLAVRAIVNDMPDFIGFREAVLTHCKTLKRFEVPKTEKNWESLLHVPY